MCSVRAVSSSQPEMQPAVACSAVPLPKCRNFPQEGVGLEIGFETSISIMSFGAIPGLTDNVNMIILNVLRAARWYTRCLEVPVRIIGCLLVMGC